MRQKDRILAAALLLLITSAIAGGILATGHQLLSLVVLVVIVISFLLGVRNAVSKKESIGSTLIRPLWFLAILATGILLRLIWLAGMIVKGNKLLHRATSFKRA